MQRWDRPSGVPPDILEHLPPKNQSVPTLLLCALTSDLLGAVPHHHLALLSKSQLIAPINKVLGQLGVFKSKPLRWLSNSPDKFTRTPTAMHMIVYSLPASRGMGSLRYSNSLELLRELETVRIKLVKDFTDEPMLVAKFPHPLNCILEYVLINSWYVEKISSGLGVSNFRPLR